MTINETKCYICGEEIDMENYYYISAGRLQQGTMSDTKSYSEYTLCGNCYPLVKAEMVASIQIKKNKHDEKK